jgi:insulysin
MCAGKRYIQLRDVVNPQEVNSAIEYNIQIGDAKDDSTRTHALLFGQIAKEPCFNILRTKEQLGYIVSGSVRKQTGVIGYRVIVQSEKSPWYLEERVELFLESLKVSINKRERERDQIVDLAIGSWNTC